jgi:hypothetical protein
VRASDWWLPGIVRQLIAALDAVRLQNAAILTNLNIFMKEVRTMSDTLQAELAALEQKVAAGDTVQGSVVTLLQDLHSKLDAALAEAQQGGVDPAALQRLHDIVAHIGAQTQALSDAVVANTPADAVANTGTVGNAGTVAANGTIAADGTV